MAKWQIWGRLEVLRCYSWNPGAPHGADHSAWDKACESEAPSRAVFMQRPFQRRTRSEGYLRFLGKWQSGWITTKTNKPWCINDRIDSGLGGFHSFYESSVRASTCTSVFTCSMWLLMITRHSFIFSALNSLKNHLIQLLLPLGIRKHLAYTTDSPRMSVLHQCEKNDALYGPLQGPFIVSSPATGNLHDRLWVLDTKLVLIYFTDYPPWQPFTLKLCIEERLTMASVNQSIL